MIIDEEDYLDNYGINIDEEEYLAHYGVLRKSGRYPWGSGDTQHQRNRSFLDIINQDKKDGLSDTEIVKKYNLQSTTQLRALRTMTINQQKLAQIGWAERLKAKQMSNVAIGQRMGINESSVRALLAPGAKDKANILLQTSEMLKRQVAEKELVYVGSGVETQLGLRSKEKLNVAIAMLQEKGYQVHVVPIPQLGTGFDTHAKVLCPPGTPWSYVAKNKDKIRQIQEFSFDGGRTYGKVHDPISMNPNRVQIRYKEDGGGQADGVVYVRPGIKDVSLGSSSYAQVRILVGDSHYIKGMAMYKDDLPPGIDLVFNSTKSSTGNKMDALKPLESDPDFPFKSMIRKQILEDVGTPHERPSSVMNIVNDQGDWAVWDKELSSQFLSKQPPSLAKAQLEKTYASKKKDFDQINVLTNPIVKKKLLKTFADETESSANHLKAAQLSRNQAWHAILPMESMKPNEIYAPSRYKDGEKVVLVRFPHAGTFEIPELTVNNRHPESRKLLGDVPDVVAIHPSVARHLSGADFDGDTVLVIPNNSKRVKTTSPLEGLKDFDHIGIYQRDYDTITKDRKQQEMGNISNLITDMTIKNAPHSHIVRAVKHSMVVIDAEKHKLDWKQSELDNNILQLKKEYQSYEGRRRGGATTFLSRGPAKIRVPQREPRPAREGGPINPETGRLEWRYTGRKRLNKDGKLIDLTTRTTRLAETDDARTLMSGTPTPMEILYADHSNKMKALANEARLSMLHAGTIEYSPSAKRVYAKEVASLDRSLEIIKSNRPLEVQAQIIADAVVKAKKAANPNLDSDTIKKLKFRELQIARDRVFGPDRDKDIKITPDEWKAIQAGAISASKLSQILAKADIKQVRQYATPHHKTMMTTSRINQAREMLDRGYNRSEVADRLGVSVDTLDRSLKGEEGDVNG